MSTLRPSHSFCISSELHFLHEIVCVLVNLNTGVRQHETESETTHDRHIISEGKTATLFWVSEILLLFAIVLHLTLNWQISFMFSRDDIPNAGRIKLGLRINTYWNLTISLFTWSCLLLTWYLTTLNQTRYIAMMYPILILHGQQRIKYSTYLLMTYCSNLGIINKDRLPVCTSWSLHGRT